MRVLIYSRKPHLSLTENGGSSKGCSAHQRFAAGFIVQSCVCFKEFVMQVYHHCEGYTSYLSAVFTSISTSNTLPYVIQADFIIHDWKNLADWTVDIRFIDEQITMSKRKIQIRQEQYVIKTTEDHKKGLQSDPVGSESLHPLGIGQTRLYVQH